MNPYKRLLGLLPARPLLVGDVIAYASAVATVQLPGGGTVVVRGVTTVGARVFIRDGLIESSAPTLTIEVIDV